MTTRKLQIIVTLIVALLGFLTGLIMAYVGLIQLRQVGATVYVANLVSLAMTREMGALMTGVIACGRTSTAFASQLGSMNVSQETDALRALVETTRTTRRALVHGDVSPKNILVGPAGPVFLDAECAWWGDPAFDLAFCSAHLLLKTVWKPAHQAAYLDAFYALQRAYLPGVAWESPAGPRSRADAVPSRSIRRPSPGSPCRISASPAS